jgi:hypothetical protein
MASKMTPFHTVAGSQGDASWRPFHLGFGVLLLSMMLSATVQAQSPLIGPSSPPMLNAETLLNADRYQRAKVYGINAMQLTAMGIGADHGFHRPTHVENVFLESDLQRLSGMGYAVEILVDDVTAFSAERARQAFAGTAKGQWPASESDPASSLRMDPTAYTVPADFTPGSMGGFYTLDEVYAKLDTLHARYPNLVSPRTPTGSLLTHEGRTQYMVKISDNVGTDEEEPNVLYTSLMHAREPMGMMSVLFYMQWLMENYGSDPRATFVVDRCQLYFVPIVNPDGYRYNESIAPGGGGLWRKNRHPNPGGSIGVDLNRNWPYEWDYDDFGSSGSGFSDVFRGSGPASEPEIANLVALSIERNFRMALNYHSFGQYLIQPWGYDNVPNPDQALFSGAQSRMVADNGYAAGTSFVTVGYAANGVSDDWFYGEQVLKDKTFSWTPEVGTWFWPSPTTIVPQSQGNVLANLLLARYATQYDAVASAAAPVSGTLPGSETDAFRLSGEHDHAFGEGHAELQAQVGTPVPHPVQQQLRIPLQWSEALGGATLRVFGLDGRVQAERTFEPGTWTGMLEMDASAWPEGHYRYVVQPQHPQFLETPLSGQFVLVR